MALFSDEEQELIAQSIANAEKSTSGEIRIAIEEKCPNDALDRAKSYFFKLGMNKTAASNGVLIYIAYIDKKFAIIGDKGINNVVPIDFWDTTKTAMSKHFSNGQLTQGIITGVSLAGQQLSKYFPYHTDDINELPNDIVFLDNAADKQL